MDFSVGSRAFAAGSANRNYIGLFLILNLQTERKNWHKTAYR